MDAGAAWNEAFRNIFFSRVLELAQRAGVRIAASNGPGAMRRNDKRMYARKQVGVRAQISIDAGSPPFDCMLSDVSVGGAKIVSYQPKAIPDRFTLLLSANGSVKRECKVAWRRGRILGVQWWA